MRGIILDTNFLMIPLTQKVDVFSELVSVCDFPFELFVLDRTLEELETIMAEQSGKNKLAASIAKQLIETKNVSIIKTVGENHVDDIIVNIAQERGYLVATQDKILRQRLKTVGVQVIFLRQRKYLVVEK